MDEFVTKPIHRQLLFEAIARVVNNNPQPSSQRLAAEPASMVAAASPEAVTLPVINWSTALSMAFGDSKLLRDLSETCLQETATLLSQMRTALGTGDMATLSRGAHTIKGQMRIFAATDAEQVAAGLEKRAHDGDAHALLSESFGQLQQQISRVQAELRQFLAGQVAIGGTEVTPLT